MKALALAGVKPGALLCELDSRTEAGEKARDYYKCMEEEKGFLTRQW